MAENACKYLLNKSPSLGLIMHACKIRRPHLLLYINDSIHKVNFQRRNLYCRKMQANFLHDLVNE